MTYQPTIDKVKLHFKPPTDAIPRLLSEADSSFSQIRSRIRTRVRLPVDRVLFHFKPTVDNAIFKSKLPTASKKQPMNDYSKVWN